MKRVTQPFALCLVCLLLSTLAQAQRRPDPRADVRRSEKGPASVEKPNRWDRGQRVKEFNNAARGRTTEGRRTEERRDAERDPRRNGPKTVEKAKRWERGQRKGEFNRVAERRAEDKRRSDRESRPDAGRRYVEKSERWRHTKSIKEDFNKVANPPPPSNPGNGGKNNGGKDGATAPPAAPGPKPRPPQP